MGIVKTLHDLLAQMCKYSFGLIRMEPCYFWVPFKRLPLKSDGTEGHEYHQRNHLLDHFQLNQVERPPVIPETDAIRRYLETILT